MQEGLRRAGRSDLLSEARFWLNLFLESMYRNQDYHWMRKAAVLSTTEGLAWPSDYLRAYSATLIQNGDETPFKQFSSDEYDMYRVASSSGTPVGFFADPDTETFKFYPTPVQSLQWRLRYYYLPTLPDPSSPIGDSDEPVWQTDPSILIQAVYVRALEYDDDNRFEREDQRLTKMIAEAKMNNFDTRAGSTRMKLGKSFRRRL
jgi:hypothetical protein